MQIRLNNNIERYCYVKLFRLGFYVEKALY